jgi:hypothetical protein
VPSVRVINEQGELEEIDLTSKRVSIELDSGERFEPAVVDRIEYDHEGEISQITNYACDKTENRRETDPKADLAIEGIVTEDQLDVAKSLKEQKSPTLVSDLFGGRIAVRRVTLEQNTDLIHFVADGEGEPQLAFEFLLQVKHSHTTSGDTTVDLGGTTAAQLSNTLDK